MSAPLASIFASLIGAVLGTLGAAILRNRYERAERDRDERTQLVQRHLAQLQDAAEGLWHRLNNLTYRDGRVVMPSEYFEVSTLYAMGLALAAERVIAVNGMLPRIESTFPGLGRFLRGSLIESRMRALGLYRYDRIGLAESTMEKQVEGFRLSTFLDFRGRYEESVPLLRSWLAPARDALLIASESAMIALMTQLDLLSRRLSQATLLPSSIPVADDAAVGRVRLQRS